MREHETSAPSGEERYQTRREAEDLQRRDGENNCAWLARLRAHFIDPTAMAEAVASARAEGFREGLERAARIAEDRPDGWGAEYSFAASLVAGDIRALIPGGSSDV